MSRSDRGGSVAEYQIEAEDRTPLCLRIKCGAGFRHLPRKGERGNPDAQGVCSLSLCQGALARCEDFLGLPGGGAEFVSPEHGCDMIVGVDGECLVPTIDRGVSDLLSPFDSLELFSV